MGYVKDYRTYGTDPEIWKTHINETIFSGSVNSEGATVTTEHGRVIVPCGAVIGTDGRALTWNEKTFAFDGTPRGIAEHSVDLTVFGEDSVDVIVQGDLIGAALFFGLDTDGDPVGYSSDIYDALKEALPRIYLDDPETERKAKAAAAKV